MKIKNLLALCALSATLFIACNKDEAPAKPVITIHELGDGDSHGNDHTATIGKDLHIDVEVVAEGKIDKIQVKLHHEGDHHHDKSTQEEEWEIDTTYTKFAGLKNVEFHEHLDIDIEAEAGEYHFDFIVTDMEGNQSSADADIEIKE